MNAEHPWQLFICDCSRRQWAEQIRERNQARSWLAGVNWQLFRAPTSDKRGRCERIIFCHLPRQLTSSQMWPALLLKTTLMLFTMQGTTGSFCQMQVPTCRFTSEQGEGQKWEQISNPTASPERSPWCGGLTLLMGPPPCCFLDECKWGTEMEGHVLPRVLFPNEPLPEDPAPPQMSSVFLWTFAQCACV